MKTREEEIRQMAKSYTQVIYDSLDDFSDITDAYVDGAKWADKTMIDKMLKWMECIDFEMDYQYSEDGYTFFDADKFINDFRKAMED